jgi:electron transfer flavoprotein beta subunit
LKTIVIYKWARATASASVRRDGQVDWGTAKMAASDDDPAALDTAKALAGPGGEVVGLTIGDGETAWVLARGVDSAYTAPGVGPLTDNAATAGALASAVRQIGLPDAVVIGDSGADPGVAAALAAHLGWPVLLGVGSAEAVDGAIVARRRAGNAVETVSVPVPAVLGVAAVGEEARPPGMMETIKARKKPVTELTVEAPAEGVAATGTRLPDRSGARLFEGDPDDAAAQLVAALRGDGVL